MDFGNIAKYVISLPEREDRRISFNNQAREQALGDFVFWTAIKGTGGKKQAQEACKISHHNLLKRAKLENIPYILIMEDDAVLAKGFEGLFNQAIKELPDDWCLFYLGANNFKPPVRHSDHIGRCVYSLSTVAYLVNQTIYDRLIEVTALPGILDMLYVKEIQQKEPCYVATPGLVSQAEGYSDIEKKRMNYSKYYCQ